MQENYREEIKMLETVYSELIEAILNKPDTADYEKSRIYFENAVARMNHWALLVNKTKAALEGRLPVRDLTADNRPA